MSSSPLPFFKIELFNKFNMLILYVLAFDIVCSFLYKVYFTKHKLVINRKALGSVYLNLLKKTGIDLAV